MDGELQSCRTRGIAFLLAAQSPDGAWRKSRYGALRGGAALTALALYALSQGEEGPRVATRAARNAAWAFLRRGFEHRPCVACPDGTLDLPVYATALTLLADVEGESGWTVDERRALVDFLRGSQLSVARGFAATDRQLGGWDLGSVPPPRGVTTGTNVSLTSWALEALDEQARRQARDATDGALSEWRQSEACQTAAGWLSRCQNGPEAGDGGFYFTPDVAATDNKAQLDPATGRPRSYGTATCDGWLALRALGVPAEDRRCQAAWKWLARQEAGPRVAGCEAPLAAGWGAGLWYYYVARWGRVVTPAADEEPWRRARRTFRELLLARQLGDGSWANEESRMREDDPLIATPLALLALESLADPE